MPVILRSTMFHVPSFHVHVPHFLTIISPFWYKIFSGYDDYLVLPQCTATDRNGHVRL